MNHSLYTILPLKKMEDDVHDGDIVSIYFDHTKLTGHIKGKVPWGQKSISVIQDDDDFLLSLHCSEGNSDGLDLRLPQYGINSKRGTISQYLEYKDKTVSVQAIGYSVVQRQWDYQIDGFIPGKVHCGFGLGIDPINGETDKDHYKIKGMLFAKTNFGPAAGILMYADPKGKYIDKILMLLSANNEEKLARTYQAKEVVICLDKKLCLPVKEPDQKIESSNASAKNTKHIETRMPFSEKSLEKIINKKVNTILDTKTISVNIVQL